MIFSFDLRHVARFFSGALLICALIFFSSSAALAGVAVGGKVPSILLPDVTTGQQVDVAEYLKGSPGAIVFMQTSCSACRRELKVLKAIVEKFPVFKVVAISVDAGGPKRVARYKEGFEFPFLFLHDPEYVKPDLFGFAYTPSLVLMDRGGKVAELKGGFRPSDEEQLNEKIAALVK
jgi:thiol-disulfide isomerase/thioredoxin